VTARDSEQLRKLALSD